jgi:hypothetical protein
MLKHCAANGKRRLSALPNLSPYIYTTLKFLALQEAPYIYDIIRLRVNGEQGQVHAAAFSLHGNNHLCPCDRRQNGP